MRGIHITGVAGVTRDCVGREAEGVVVVSQRNNSGATGQADVAVPARGEGGHGEVDEQLDGMTARSRIGEVADRLVELALGTPAGLVPDIAGPRVYGMAELLRGYLRARGRHRPIVPVPLPGKAARAFRAGANLAPDRDVGRRTWEDFLAARVSSPSDGRSGPT